MEIHYKWHQQPAFRYPYFAQISLGFKSFHSDVEEAVIRVGVRKWKDKFTNMNSSIVTNVVKPMINHPINQP
jgi:hypothetical protein